ncbi:SDR family oxidoreductase [Fulvivirgaceae bacterium PWU4]|uniref:SDR family oxidoreductase n=1 Tax=Chryseosolibacter histidini TaxID=2782349 RepID=A0AAP2GMZ9_9BACT|nr:SDR family oxidoreductase [Chryseosolibacter histidini]MBT1697493.1 SDR family oxidoreductase [Chryseosolibacter histidini]
MRKLIVVTGGSKGIGRAILEKFSQQGFDVVTCSRNEPELNDLKDNFRSAYPGIGVFTFRADMAEKSQVRAFTDFVLGLGRPVDVLVNNAGHFIPGELSTEPDGTLERMINANLYSAYHATRGLVHAMRERKAGHIFNICSIASIKAYPNGGAYAISKFAMLGFSKCLREELKPFNIRVTAVMPGATQTRSWEGANLPDERFMKIEDIAETVYAAYSLSERSVVEEIILRPQLGDI